MSFFQNIHPLIIRSKKVFRSENTCVKTWIFFNRIIHSELLGDDSELEEQ